MSLLVLCEPIMTATTRRRRLLICAQPEPTTSVPTPTPAPASAPASAPDPSLFRPATAAPTTTATPPPATAPSSSPASPELVRTVSCRHRLTAATVHALAAIPAAPSARAVLSVVCAVPELSVFRIRPADRAFLSSVALLSPVRWPLEPAGTKPTEPAHKVFLLVQLALCGTPWPARLTAPARRDLLREQGHAFRALELVLRGLVDVLGARADGAGVRVTLHLLRSLLAGVWDEPQRELRQIAGIGPVSVAKFADAGISSVRQLTALACYDIERLMRRNPPYGHNTVKQLAHFPLLTLDASAPGRHAGLAVVRLVLGFSNPDVELPQWKGRTPWVTVLAERVADKHMGYFWRGSLKSLVGGKELVFGVDARPGNQLTLYLCCEAIAGTKVEKTIHLL